MVVIDPRKTMTAEQADLHLAVRPGSDVWLFNGLSRYLLEHDLVDNAYIENHVNGFSELHALVMAPEYELARVAEKCGLTISELQTFYRWFGENEKAVTLFCQGINQSNQGTDKGNSLINPHLLTGRIGKPGASPFSMTGQPNAMGGREVGGLATQLASHMTFNDENCDRVARFWNAPNIARKPGLKAVDMFKAVGEGKIRALWVIATNPAVSLPDSVQVREALAKCEFLVVSEMTPKTDTAQFAHLLLPAAGWGERSGTVTNSERCMTRQRAFTQAPGEAKPDWWALTQLGKRLGFADAFNYDNTADIFREHAELSGFENSGRQFDISALATMTDDEYEQFTPRQWPLPADKTVESSRLFTDGVYSTFNGRANLVPVIPQEPVLKRKAERQEGSWLLNTGRLRDQWHTMTRTGHLPRLMETEPLPKVYVNHQTILNSGFTEGALIRINSLQGSVMTLLGRDDGLRDGEAFMPMHWSDDFSSCSGVNRLVAPVTDTVSGQPQFKQTEVVAEAVDVKWHGLWVGQHAPELEVSWWARRPLDAGECRRLTDETRTAEQVWFQLAQQGRWLRLPLKGGWLAVKLNQGRIIGLLLVGTTHQQVNIDLLAGLLGLPMNSTALSTTLEQALAGDSRMICSCFRVSEKQIVDAIGEQGISELSGLQSLLRCGTNCGTCVVELKKLLHKHTSVSEV
jgi:assimilatory nitrate reductase catalytic subunit